MTFPSPFYRWRPHPWHGLEVGPDAPDIVHAYIEITPIDSMKYELDKVTGYLRVDRPQQTSSLPPTLYGIIPRTYCGKRVGSLMEGATKGDGDPLDICVVSERPIIHSEVILNARVVGSLPMNDQGEADDKIIAILENDPVLGGVRDLAELPNIITDRLRHYFMTYKLKLGEESQVSIGEAYDSERAKEIILAAMADYEEEYGS